MTQNAQTVTPPVTSQTRSYTYDGLGRLTSETNAESGQTTYVYDSDPAPPPNCGSSSGDRVKRVDALANANTTCYAYDALHRVTSITYSGQYAANTPNKYLVYDAATINTTPTTTMANAKGRLAEAYTATSPTGAKITDIGLSYSARGEVNDVYQSTPQSGGYYHLNETYWANGVPSQLSGNIGLPTINYGVDGEGRTSTVSAVAPAQNLVTGTLYNLASQPYQVNLGTGDSDAFGYDPNTARMTQYQFTVNGQSVVGTLSWNSNATLQQLSITDPFNAANTQTCTYSYDDLTRIAGANCGTAWAQTFSYDPFGNISKDGSMSFQPTYSPTTNRMTSLPGFTPTYDNNGNVLNDNFHVYTWDAEGRPVTIGGGFFSTVSLTYDALGRMVEQNRLFGGYTQIVYAPTGEKLALMNGQTLQKAFVPLPGKATAVYTSAGLSYYRHPDWLGSSRFASTPTRTMYSDSAYAPFGEPYAQAGTSDLSFAGLNQDTVGGLYDAGAREYSIQGRWPSPDPAGISSMHLTDPQSLDRYAYARNDPLGYVDPSGRDWWDFFGGGGWGGGIWDEHLPWDWPLDLQSLLFGRPRLEDFIISDWSPAGHDAIYQHALGPCGVPQNEIDKIKAGSREWDDKTGLSTVPEFVNSHAMLAEGQTIEEAIKGRNDFISDRLWAARDAWRHGNADFALRELGFGTHPVGDMTSRAHDDKDKNGNLVPIIWCGPLGLCKGSNVSQHSRYDIRGIERVQDLNSGVFALTDQAIRDAYSFVTGRTLSCH